MNTSTDGNPSESAQAPYGFHNLDRLSIVLADGTARFYFALPPDYPFQPSHSPRPSPYDFESLLPSSVRSSQDELQHGNSHGVSSCLVGDSGSRPAKQQKLEEDEVSRCSHEMPSCSAGDSGRFNLGDLRMAKQQNLEEDELFRPSQNVLQFGNSHAVPSSSAGDGGHLNVGDSRPEKHQEFSGGAKEDRPMTNVEGKEKAKRKNYVELDVDNEAVNLAFIKFVKIINASPKLKRKYSKHWSRDTLYCLACTRKSRSFTSLLGLLSHSFNLRNPELRVDHLGLYKAICVLLGWNHLTNPENKGNRKLSTDDAEANREDLIIWPPTVVIHTTGPGRDDADMEANHNKEMDAKLRELGFFERKGESVHVKVGKRGVTMLKFADTLAGLKEAEQLAEYFEKDNHGRKGWALFQASHSGNDRTTKICYGYLATAFDLDKLDNDAKKCAIKSRKELSLSS